MSLRRLREHCPDRKLTPIWEGYSPLRPSVQDMATSKESLPLDVPALVDFNRQAIARALNLIEDRRPSRQAQSLALLDELSTLSAPAHVVGLTGPPGVGKSSLISRLIEQQIQTDRRIAIIAVDPSSKVSGGALLGDRGRMQLPAQARVYARSYAARDRLGGLSHGAFSAVFLLRHCCDIILVETVGVGQSETDIANLADTTVLVIQPFSGDMLQFIKAGVMEIPDILAVNKADDRALAQQALSEVQAALALEQSPSAHTPVQWSNPVLAVSAATNLNIDALDQAMSSHYEYLQSTANLEKNRATQQMAWVTGEILHEVGTRGLAALGGRDGVRLAWQQQPAHWSAVRKLTALIDRVL